MVSMDTRGWEGKEDHFIYSGEQGYYGRICINYLKKCDECKWQDNIRCREGMVKG